MGVLIGNRTGQYGGSDRTGDRHRDIVAGAGGAGRGGRPDLPGPSPLLIRTGLERIDGEARIIDQGLKIGP
jgi:hypothetical protein